MSTRYIEGLLRAVTSSKAKLDLQSVLSTLTSATAAASGPLDHLYARIGALNGPFFPSGWGNLSIVNYEEDLRHLIQGPQSSIKISWHLVERGNRDGTDYVLYEGVFRTPCLQRVYDALPLESRTSRVQLLMPAHLQPIHPQPLGAELPPQTLSAWQHSSADWEGHTPQRGPHAMAAAADGPACVIHLAATGDQTFGRRLRLGFPLLKDNVCSMVLESPFYGARRPAAQRGSKLLRVSDLLTLGWATIAESVNLLHWLREEGYGSLGLCGLSMGGVHASMAAGLYPGDVAVAPLLAPRSAAVAYCDGAMRAAMAWEPLLQEVDENNTHITHVVLAAGRAITVQVPVTHGSEPGTGAVVQSVAYMREATYALADLELRGEKEHLATGSTTASAAGTTAAVGRLPAGDAASTSAGASAAHVSAGVATAVVDGGERRTTDEVGPDGGRQTGTAPSAAPRVASSPNAATSVVGVLRGVSVMDLYGKLAGVALRTAGGMGGGGGGTEHAAAAAPLPQGAAAVTNAVSSGPHSTADPHSFAHTNPWLGRLQHAPPAPAVSSSPQSPHAAATPQTATLTPPTDRPGSGTAKAATTTTTSNSTTTSTTSTTAAVDSGQVPGRRLLGEMARAFQHLRAGDRQLDNPATVMRLKRVLETYTDITRYPRPRRTDAAVIVAARDDAYVDPESVRQLHRYWSGSELRMVSGGHVSAFLMHQEAFRGAIRDSLVRVRLPPPPPSPSTP